MVRMRSDQCPGCNGVKDKRANLCQECRLLTYQLDGKRTCTKCKTVKKVDEFRIRTRKTPRPRSVCKECEKQIAKEIYYKKDPKIRKVSTRNWEKNNPEKHQIAVLRKSIRSLGFVGSEVDRIANIATNTKICNICRVDIKDAGYTNKKLLCIDHCHKSGKFRGMLCARCNNGLGLFKDDPNILESAINYLLAHSGPNPSIID